jgi:hypothetical protein
MITPDSASGSVFDLRAAVRAQSWTWLGAIVRRFKLAVEIVDDRGILCAPIMAPSHTTPLRRVLDGSPSYEFRAALDSALQTNQQQRASADGIDVLCLPLALGDATIGALVLTRDPPPHASSADARSDAEIDAAASWLARAIEAQLDGSTTEHEDAEAFDRVSSLQRLLHDVVDRGVEHEVLTSFAEALIAWDDIEVRAYVEDIHGRFMLAVATPGIDRGEAERVPSIGSISGDRILMRLPFTEAARLGFRRDSDVFLARIGGNHSQPWLLLFSGVISAPDESRLALYVDLLREAVVRVATIAETRTSWAILQPLLGHTDSVEEIGQAALAELTRVVDGLGSALVVTASNGVPTLNIADNAAFSTVGQSSQVDELVSTHHVLDVHTMVLTVRRAHGNPFTRREQQLVDRAAATFAAWLPGVLPGLPQVQERRTENRGFDEVVDRVAVQQVADGLDVVMLVVVAPAAVSRPGLLHKWVAEIRGQLRASDLAGSLSDREIGVLLSGTTPNDLAAVRARILRRVTVVETGRGTARVAIGVASRSAGVVAAESLVRLARQDAARRASGSEWA